MYIHSSNVIITSLNTEDKWRTKILEHKSKSKLITESKQKDKVDLESKPKAKVDAKPEPEPKIKSKTNVKKNKKEVKK